MGEIRSAHECVLGRKTVELGSSVCQVEYHVYTAGTQAGNADQFVLPGPLEP